MSSGFGGVTSVVPSSFVTLMPSSEVLRPQRLDLRDELFLDGGVGEPLPLVHLAQVVEFRRHDGHRRLDALDEGVLFARGHGRWRIHRRLQIADRTIGLAQRQIFGCRPRRDALEQLFDALHLLLQRPLGRRALLLLALAHARLGFGESGRDRFVQAVGLAGERLPLRHDRTPLLLAIAGRLAGGAVVAVVAGGGIDSRSASSDSSPSRVWTRSSAWRFW